MATTDATIAEQFARRDDWALETYDTFAGAFTEVKIKGAGLDTIGENGKDLLITGIAVNWVRGGGGVSFFPRVHVLNVKTGLPISIDLPRHTTTDSIQPVQYTNLAIPLLLNPGTIISLVGTTVALDYARIDVWGTYRHPAPDNPPTQPVAVQGEVKTVWPPWRAP